jgi:hypothetical protein
MVTTYFRSDMLNPNSQRTTYIFERVDLRNVGTFTKS